MYINASLIYKLFEIIKMLKISFI